MDGTSFALELRKLSKSLGGQTLFSELNLAVKPGESLALTGESGSGKSTLLHIAAGLEPADEGEVIWNGRPLTGLNQNALSQRRLLEIGLVFQAFYLMPHLTALQNVQLPYLLKGQRPDTSRCQDLLDQVGLLERSKAYPKELSGGEQQRVAIARALALKPPIVLADEPTGSLDPLNAQRTLEVLLGVCRQAGCALITVTHSQEIAARMDRKLCLANQSLQAIV